MGTPYLAAICLGASGDVRLRMDLEHDAHKRVELRKEVTVRRTTAAKRAFVTLLSSLRTGGLLLEGLLPRN